MAKKATIIIEEASLELVPEKYWRHSSCSLVEERFGIPPNMQILDDNYHHKIIPNLGDHFKRGRPDVVHFALLDITGTPAFIESSIDVYIHTLGNITVRVLPGVRPPRTLQRFCGVMSKMLTGRSGEAERRLFEISKGQSVRDLVDSLDSERIVSLTTEGISRDLCPFLQQSYQQVERVSWIIGGFPHGHFSEDVKTISSDLISVSKYSLPAHVVAARLCFAIEQSI